ncbi:MAG: hypothetical protein HY320_12415 [Armatimonadetes bacterium]|nr:hypothetical protein [Armatimonadota bacterium]
MDVVLELLLGDLDFKGQDSSYASHNFHAFAAKFPPQLPRLFIERLTCPGDVVVDPMMGSGTALLEAYLAGRWGVGCDLDPLAVQQALVKATPLDTAKLVSLAQSIVQEARNRLMDPEAVAHEIARRYTEPTREFLDYWFLPETQRELMALLLAIERISTPANRSFFEVAFSSIIITKSGGVSRARDLAHSRPHRVLEKKPRNAVDQFEARVARNIESIRLLPDHESRPLLCWADARCLPFPDRFADLVVTSPPYANAIDYMRAHKFSLVWFGRQVEDLAALRARYIGTERTRDFVGEPLPPMVDAVITQVAGVDSGKARILQKYYCDMRATIVEMHRILKPERAVVIVVGTSTMRGIDVQTHHCLADIAASVGFQVAPVAERRLDRDKRMMPARSGTKTDSMIEQRMHSEFVIAGIKRAA